MTIPPERLNERDFIQNEPRKWDVPSWVWFFLLLLFCGLFLQFFMWFWHGKPTASQPPFYRVTNREMSLFLWQNPNFMKKANPDAKRYLFAFDSQDGVAMEPDVADQFVIAPPELLFRYHTWNRLLKKEFSDTPIPVDEFLKFLTYAKEWLPANWPASPDTYEKLIPELPQRQTTDLSKLPQTVLPLEVRIAFQGWNNYFRQRKEIEQLKPTKQEISTFLLAHPNYARNFWRNIDPNYLKSLGVGEELPPNEVPPFLKQALFNAKAGSPS